MASFDYLKIRFSNGEAPLRERSATRGTHVFQSSERLAKPPLCSLCRAGLFSRSKDGFKFGYSTLHDGDTDIDGAALVARGIDALQDKGSEGEASNGRDGRESGSNTNTNTTSNDRDRDRDDDGSGGREEGEEGNRVVRGGDAPELSRDATAESDAVDEDYFTEDEGHHPVSGPTRSLFRRNLLDFRFTCGGATHTM